MNKKLYDIKTIYVGHRVYEMLNELSIRVNVTVKEITLY